jgi:hypothetical protein
MWKYVPQYLIHITVARGIDNHSCRAYMLYHVISQFLGVTIVIILRARTAPRFSQ